MKSTIYKKGMRFKKGDVLAAQFGSDRPSIFQVLKSDKKKNKLLVRVLADFYKNPTAFGSIIDIGPYIFDKTWFFTKVKASV